MKKTLLEIVKSILSDMDSEDVNSIADSVEALQVASVVEDTFYNMVATKFIPEHRELIKLEALSDSEYPTYFRYPSNVKDLEKVYYSVGPVGDLKYREIKYAEPLDFLNSLSGSDNDNNRAVLDKNSGTTLYIGTNKDPSCYTSFDDEHIIMDSLDVTMDDTLQESKSRAYGTVYPTFSHEDNFEPDLDETLLPFLLAEAKSTCFSLYKAGSDPKIEQAARRQKSAVQNDMFKTKQENKRTNYGRR